MKFDLIAIDEAHCISQWGFDFRPAYLTIPIIRQFHPQVPLIALTATASEKVLKDIVSYLQLEDPKIFRKSFERENIHFFSIKTVNKLNELLNIVNKLKGSGIIYTRNRKNTIQIANWLSRHNIDAISYHAGMKSTDRETAQNKWKNNQVRLAIATNAFGMGIDKSNVEFVIHLDIPGAIEEYYQEAGRAGRDGSKSFAICILNEADIENARVMFDKQYPDFDTIKRIYIKLCQYFKLAIGSGYFETFAFVLDDFATYIDFDYTLLSNGLKILENEGWITLSQGFTQPSQVLIIASKEDIYSLNYSDTIYDDILSTLLRNYEGIWSFHVKIDEQKIAKILSSTKSEVENKLLILYRDGIIDYRPTLEESAITFIKPRPQNEYFAIERHRYEASKKLAQERLFKMINYLTADTCRQQYILAYFGEEKPPCGKCDICMGSNKTTLKKADIDILNRHLQKLSNGVDLDYYLMAWPYHKRNAVRNLLSNYEKKDMVSIKSGKIFISPAYKQNLN
jgi:ATP-dependent DNA helicase RecQ